MIVKLIEELLLYAQQKLSLSQPDLCYTRNQLLDLFDLDCPYEGELTENCDDLFAILNPMIDYAIANKLVTADRKDLFEAKLLGLVTPTPQRINDLFEAHTARGSVRDATTWFYELCKSNNYIKTREIAKNKKWDFTAERGDIMVTVNLSKPEKDPKEVALAKKMKSVDYPKCMLCLENMGYRGRANFPARQTLRSIFLPLANDNFYLQFSPYSYFDEHCIAFSETHVPMEVNADTIDRLFDFVELIPHYFIGSNASLPIVGGSILAHEHYQGGRKVQPMFKRPIIKDYRHEGFDSVRLGVVDWYNTVLRIRGKKRSEVKKACKYVMEAWNNYSDQYVTAKTDEQHNCITPVCRMERGEVFMEFILRNNRTDSEHPYGIFHPTEDMHNIKKEAIGIIEALGLFILPGRLDGEMKAMVDYLTGVADLKKIKSDSPIYKHLDMLKSIIDEKGKKMSAEQAENAIVEYINEVCKKILYCTAVYKPYDEQQMQALYAFIESLGFVEAQVILDQLTEKQRQAAEEQRQLKKEEAERLIKEKEKEKEREREKRQAQKHLADADKKNTSKYRTFIPGRPHSNKYKKN